jgi:hypothetical protein
MLVLDTTSKTITAVLSAAPATNQPNYVVAWADNNGTTFTEGASDGTLNGTSTVTMVASPAASTRRVIKSINIQNTDTAQITVTVGYYNGTNTRVIAKVTLNVGDTWTTDATFDSNGQIKTTSSGGGGSGTVTSVAATVPGFLSVSGSPITTSGTLAISYSGTALPLANGGTGQTTASAAFNALSPITSTGDLILGNGTNSATRLAIGASTYVLTSNGTTASWAAPSGGGSGTVTSVAATVPSFLTVTGSPITSSGTLAISLASTPANGQLLIGNGTGLSYATLTAGTGITITNGSGSIQIDSTGGGGGTSFGSVITTAQGWNMV